MKKKTALELLVALVFGLLMLFQEYRRMKADDAQLRYTSYIHAATTIPDAPAETWGK